MDIDNSFEVKHNGCYPIKSGNVVMRKAISQWNEIVRDGDEGFRKCDSDLYTSIIYNLEVKRIYLDPTLTLSKFSHTIGTNTTYLSNAINKYFKCNLKNLINRYRVEHAKYLLDHEHEPVKDLPRKCGFTSRSVFYVAFKRTIGVTPLQYASSVKENISEFK